MNLKKEVSGLRRKFTLGRTSRAKRGNVFHIDEMTESEWLDMAEIERLCSLEDRLRNLKKALLSCKYNDYESIKTHSTEENVIYVPVVEVKEKAFI